MEWEKSVNRIQKHYHMENVCTSELRQKISMLTMEKNILGSLSARRNYADLCRMKKQRNKAYCCDKEYSMYRKIS